MAGLIKREDIALVREQTRIDEIVGQYVTLKSAGTGSMKGLCPFHDERTPSFHVRPLVGLWHCFGCSEGGDAIAFVQKLNHLSFSESVEYLAAKAGITLHYEEGGVQRRSVEPGRRQRLIEAHRLTADFFRKHLDSPEGKLARDFIRSRGFGKEEVDRFGIGSSPSSWDGVTSLLRSKGFTDEELQASGLAIQGNRGLYDRFRGRVMWPIRDLTGATIGFGARKLDDDPNSPKYLNTPETIIYKKSQVLYGLDLAKKDISRSRKVVVVEGYTDVMAAHAAGIPVAIATCGTAFGSEHTQIIRRLLGDVASPAAGVVLSSGRAPGGEVIFTFDGDEAGKAAARRAYAEDQSFAAQTFVAVDPRGDDPCDIRLKRGDQALKDLVDSRVPLFEFVLRSVLADITLDSAEGRVQGLRVSAPILAGIKDRALRAEYSRQVAGWLGMEPREVDQAQRSAGMSRRSAAEFEGPQSAPPALSDPIAVSERNALAAAVQRPLDVIGAGFETLETDSFVVPTHRAVFQAIGAGGGLDGFLEELAAAEAAMGTGGTAIPVATRRWMSRILEGLDAPVAEALTGLMVQPLPVSDADDPQSYAQGIVRSVVRRDLVRQASNLQAKLRRTNPDSPEYSAVFSELMELEARRRSYSDVL